MLTDAVRAWLSVLRVIMKAAKREHQLTHLATEHIDNFDVSEHESGAEQRRAVAQVIQLFARRDAAEDEIAVTKVNQ